MAEKKPDRRAPQTLGAYLANLRQVKKMTLREVEDATHKEVSNAYLSQLEHGRIAKPAPNVLHSLAEVYGVPYDSLMERAGYLRRDDGKSGRLATFAIEDLTPEEEEALLEYLAFLRFSKGKR